MLTNTKGLTLVILTKQSMRLVISLAVKQNMKEFLMAMWNMWCHFSFFLVRQILFRSDSFSKLPDRMSDKLSWIFDMSVIVFNATFNNIAVISWRSVCWWRKPVVPRENHKPVTSH